MSFSDINQSEKIQGGTDGTLIGNEGDYLKVLSKADTDNDPTIDFTNRIKIANAEQRFKLLWNYNLNPVIVATQSTNGGAVSPPTATQATYARLVMPTTSNATAVIQSKKNLRYVPYREHELNFALITGAGDANQVTMAGQYNDLNGSYWRKNGTTWQVGYRNNTDEVTGTIETNISQASWNYDTLDGTGPSGLNFFGAGATLTFNGPLVFYIRYLFHGASGIEWGVEYYQTKVPVHRLKWSGTNETRPFFRTAVLPFRAECENTAATSSANTVLLGPVSFDVHGGEPLEGGITWGASNQATTKSANSTTAFVNVIAVRPKATFGPNSVPFRGTLRLSTYGIYTDNSIYYEIISGANITATFTSVNTESAAEFATGTITYTGGRVVASGYLAGSNNSVPPVNNSFERDLEVSYDTINNVAEGFLLRVVKIGSNASVGGAFTWGEIY